MDVKKFEFLKTVAFQKGRGWGVGGGQYNVIIIIIMSYFASSAYLLPFYGSVAVVIA